jgi:hypothetical protein
MDDEVGLADLLQRRAERLDQLVRQVPDEAHRVGQRVDPALGGAGLAGSGVQGGEQRVLDQHAGPGEPIEQTGLAGVGVTRDRDAGHRVPPAAGPLGLADGRHAGDLASQPGDPRTDAPPVGLELGLTRTAQADAAVAAGRAAGLPAHRLTPTAQARQQVLQLRQLDLGLALLALRVLGEDVQDQGDPVDDLDLGLGLQVAQLAGRELAVADDGVGTGRGHDSAQVADLAPADVRGRVGPLPALDQPVEHLRAGRVGQRRQFGERVLRVLDGALGPHPDEDHPFEAELPVLDLGDVGQFGRQAGDAAQRVAVLEIEDAGAGYGVE